MGDQYYEDNPTQKDVSAAPELDFLYKYLLSGCGPSGSSPATPRASC